MFDWEGEASAKHEAQRLSFLTCSRPDSQTLNLVKVIASSVRNKDVNERGGEKNGSDSGRDLNPRPGKWPAML